ncbi:GDSL-type esterase/lipase family protein [Chryseobacterium oryzae]|uniref:GDSL-type esterase/lipase family protein n=1 Tax=Chryseobacterium oryzae TaxID=2929799 RepID=A0ABY4BD46_9FLAO|nr:GDSL-type esterase/lipase family protein [Chryseobacterium oryzae]UOE37047.1 GDSL-type esterase/lipase family protein [Chryseobacterium oryzae]
MKNIFSFILIFTFGFFLAQIKKPIFWDDIQNFKKIDQQTAPPENAILLLGSSSFTKWQDVSDYFPGKTIINRGFGGSRLKDLNDYADDLLKPYHPKQIIIYCGENDLADNTHLKPETVVARYKEFYAKIRERFPMVQVDYISIKFSPSREHLWQKIKEVNSKISKFMKKEKNADYIDITQVMNDSNGNIRRDLFLDDMLHITPEGYRLWSSVMNPYIK